jgi:hypothetical protein
MSLSWIDGHDHDQYSDRFDLSAQPAVARLGVVGLGLLCQGLHVEISGNYTLCLRDCILCRWVERHRTLRVDPDTVRMPEGRDRLVLVRESLKAW